MKFRSSIGLSSVAAAGLTIATLATAGTATAAEIGQVCNVKMDRLTLVIGPNYWLGPGAGVRILGFPSPNYYTARGNGLPEGAVWRDDINQSSCHWE
jgi:hypothetical protein